MKQSTRSSTSIVDKLRRQSPAPAQNRLRNGSSKTSEPDRISYVQTSTTTEANASDSNSDSNSVTMFQLDPQDIHNENESVNTETADNLNKDLLCTRVDLKIRVNAHSNPEEQTVLTLQKFLKNYNTSTLKPNLLPGKKNQKLPHYLTHSISLQGRQT